MRLRPLHVMLCSTLIAMEAVTAFAFTVYPPHRSPFSPGTENGFVSFSDSPFRPLTNPALGGFSRDPSLYYRVNIFDTSRVQSHEGGVSAWGFSLIYGWYNSLYDMRCDRIVRGTASRFTMSKAFWFRNILSVGASYSFSASDDRRLKGYGAWSAGLALRPWKWMSFGFAMQELGARLNGNRLDWREHYSLSVRPGTERVVLSAEAVRGRNVPVKKMDYRFGVDIRTPGDFLVWGRGDSRLNFRVGCSIPVSFPWKQPAVLSFDYDRLIPERGPGSQLIGASVTLGRSESPLRIARGTRYLYLKVNRGYAEIMKRDILGRKRTIWADILLAVRAASDDPGIAGVILNIRSVPLALNQIQELRDELSNLRKKGKTVHAILVSPGNKEYYLATAAGTIYYSPQNLFYFTGLRGQVYFYKGLMDKVGIKFEAVKSGAYKSYPESFTREHMSDESRANLTSIITQMNDQYLNDIAAGRSLKRADIDALFADGALTPEEAAKRRFVDRVMYPDEAFKAIGRGLVYVDPARYLRERSLGDRDWGMRPRIAVICVSGAIVSGQSFKTGGSASIGDDTYKAALDRAFGDPLTKAVVIRIDSGGGSAQASDTMWRHLVIKKKQNPKKPVIFSFGSMAASGGYYIACTGDRIFSGRATMTGSIGVFTGKISLERLYALLGISRDVIKMSEFADAFTEARDFTPREKELVRRGVAYLYDQFTAKVLTGRKLTPDSLPRVAEGRVMTGEEARSLSLVDEIGGFTAAVAMARSMARVDDRYELVFSPDAREGLRDLFRIPLFDFLSNYFRAYNHIEALREISRDRGFYLFPYDIEIE